MAYQKGSEMLLKLDVTGSGSYTTIGGIVSQDFEVDNPLVDVSNQGSANKSREGLAGASIRSLKFSGSGKLNSSAPTPTLFAISESRANRNWTIIIPGWATYVGPFQMTNFRLNGTHDKEVGFSASFESTGDWTGTAA